MRVTLVTPSLSESPSQLGDPTTDNWIQSVTVLYLDEESML